MKGEDYKQFANALGVLCEIHGKELSPLATQVYFKALEKFSIEEVEAAFSNAHVNCKWFPKPVELIELIQGGPENLSDRAEVEAGKVLQAIKSHGAYLSVQLDDPVTAAVIQQGFGGWIKLCEDLKADSEKWFRKDFVKIYQAYARQGIKYDGHLAGLIEAENTTRGFTAHIPEPVLIGYDDKPKRIQDETDITGQNNRI